MLNVLWCKIIHGCPSRARISFDMYVCLINPPPVFLVRQPQIDGTGAVIERKKVAGGPKEVLVLDMLLILCCGVHTMSLPPVHDT